MFPEYVGNRRLKNIIREYIFLKTNYDSGDWTYGGHIRLSEDDGIAINVNEFVVKI